MKDSDWKAKLSPEQYHVLREKGTEYPGSGKLLYNKDDGMYLCAGCGTPVFSSKDKYESTLPGLIGWPSFSEATDDVELIEDDSLGMRRTEARCKVCGGHLGHLFDDPSSPNGKHYCINSAALDFNKQKGTESSP